VKEYITIPYNLESARIAIEEKQPDILVYTDIGMDILIYLLAYSRLAPIQCVLAGGHPITTGLPTIDYSLSGEMLEPENAPEHYSEKLIRFKQSMPEIFPAPKIPDSPKTRKELGLPEDMRLYICPVRLFRIHPDMDAVFREILARDPKSMLILVESDFKNLWRETLENRLQKTIPDSLRTRIKFIPFAKGDDFFHLLSNMDAILDPFHFSLGTTLFTSFAAGLPVVTMAGKYMRGRGAFGYYKQIGVMALVAKNPEEYINLALKIANTTEFREDIKSRIKANSAILFNDYRVMEELKDFFVQLIDS
jgi:predicted O-linked N-acetylglucosamine transferase (SPINDLY family)